MMMETYNVMKINESATLFTDRMFSFRECESNIPLSIFANTGFVYQSGVVKCSICSFEMDKRFDHIQNLIIYHQNVSPNCSFNVQHSQLFKETTIDQTMLDDMESSLSDDIDKKPEPMQYEVSLSNPYKDEKKRYLSLMKSEQFCKRALELAKAGFFVVRGKRELIRCFACSLNIVSLKQDDNPTAIHQQLNPECPFINMKNVGNIPYDKIQDIHQDSNKNTRQRCKIHINTFGTHERHPEMISLNSRLNTFASYPANSPIISTMLAVAGFFYQGNGYQVVCFQCGLSIKKWNIDDDPWIEHARWNQSCSFVLMKKGKPFVKQSINFVHALKEQKRHSGVLAGYGKPGDDNIEAGVRSVKTHATVYREKPDIPEPVAEFLKGDVVEDVLLMGFCFIFIQDAVLQYYFEFGSFPQAYDLIALLNDISESDCKGKMPPMKEIENDLKRMRMTSTDEIINVCSICYEYPPSVLFLGCGHLTTCDNCSASPKLLTCPICRVEIKGTTKAFFS